jgi:pimeloyl-ACP methyl ester carboxylesterase
MFAKSIGGIRVTQYAGNGQVRIAFEDLGGAGGDPLLLIMGLGVSRFWWPDSLVSEFVRRGFHVAAYDQRDAGQSTHFPDAGTVSPLAAVARRRSPAYSAEDMTDDAAAVLDALGWDSAHLFGHSMGGQLAQRLALRHPGRVRSLTSSASLPSDVSGLAAARYIHLGLVAKLARLRFPADRDGDIALAVAATRAIASPAYPFDEQQIRLMAARDEVSGVRDAAAQSRQVGAKWHGGRLAELRVPALVLHGSADPLLRPAAARRTAKAISGARLVILPGVGHYLPAEVYPQLAGEVRTVADRSTLINTQLVAGEDLAEQVQVGEAGRDHAGGRVLGREPSGHQPQPGLGGQHERSVRLFRHVEVDPDRGLQAQREQGRGLGRGDRDDRLPAIQRVRLADPRDQAGLPVQQSGGGVRGQGGVLAEADPDVRRVQGEFIQPHPGRGRHIDRRGQEAHVDAQLVQGAGVQRFQQGEQGLVRLQETVGAFPPGHGVPLVPDGLVEVRAGVRLTVERGLDGRPRDLRAAAQMAEHLGDVPLGRARWPGEVLVGESGNLAGQAVVPRAQGGDNRVGVAHAYPLRADSGTG